MLIGRILRPLRAAFGAGLVVVVPIVATYLALRFVFQSIDGLLGPWVADLIGKSVPGLGLLVTIGLVLLAGLLAKSLVGRRLVSHSERLVLQVPLVRSIYRASREIVQTATLSRRQVFRDVVLLEYPRKGLYSFGFVTGYTRRADRAQSELANVFIPGPPVPTTGILIAAPVEELTYLDLTVEEALKLVLSGGMVTPPELRVRDRATLGAAGTQGTPTQPT
jgi:uncharacterized membrane protein